MVVGQFAGMVVASWSRNVACNPATSIKESKLTHHPADRLWLTATVLKVENS